MDEWMDGWMTRWMRALKSLSKEVFGRKLYGGGYGREGGEDDGLTVREKKEKRKYLPILYFPTFSYFKLLRSDLPNPLNRRNHPAQSVTNFTASCRATRSDLEKL